MALATPALFLEYEDVLKRPEQKAASGLTLGQIDALLTSLSSAVEPVSLHFTWRPQLRDEDDEMVLDAAINGRAAALVTHNVADFTEAEKLFGIKVVRPGVFLREIMT